MRSIKPVALSLGSAVVLLGALASPSFALTYGGNTTGQPTWNRPNQSGGALSNNTPPYQAQAFVVDQTGSYSLIAQRTGSWGLFTFLYRISFNPATPLANFVAGNNDLNSVADSGFNSITLTAGEKYFFVVTGQNNGSFGAYTATISGPGTITPVPFAFTPLPGLALGCAVKTARRIAQRKQRAAVS